MNFAEQLKSQLDIVEVVGQYVRLKRQGAGQRYVGLCPFHSEKTPSFGVHSAHQFYKCFGCDASGDVLKFVQQIEGLTFPETLRLLSERYGIAMPERQRGLDPEMQHRAALLEVHEAAATIFQDNLRGPGGADARRYLESRGVSRASADEFRLGLADASGQQLVQRLQKYDARVLEDSGLVRRRQEGTGVYDYFRGRLMFPIHDESGKVIAFGGRALRPDDKVKYLNSPETKLYSKSSVLYNLHRAKIDARKNDRMILVEGYMDVIGIYAAGIHEVVASCGTSLTPAQILSIRRQLSDQHRKGFQVFVNFDPDAAGANATEKTIVGFRREGFRVKIVQLPEGSDADDYIREHGAEAYRKRLEEAPPHHFWMATQARSKFDMATAEGRVDAFRYVQPAIELIRDRIERSAVTREMAEYLQVERETVAAQFKQTVPSAGDAPPRQLSSAVPPNEKLLLACLLASDQARAIFRHYFASANHGLDGLTLQPIFEAIRQIDEEVTAFSIPALSQTLDPRLQRILGEISFLEYEQSGDTAAGQAMSCLQALETKIIARQGEVLRAEIRKLEQAGNLTEALRLTGELGKLQGRLRGM